MEFNFVKLLNIWILNIFYLSNVTTIISRPDPHFDSKCRFSDAGGQHMLKVQNVIQTQTNDDEL